MGLRRNRVEMWCKLWCSRYRPLAEHWDVGPLGVSWVKVRLRIRDVGECMH